MAQNRTQLLFWSAYSRVYDGLLKLQPYAELISESVDHLEVSEGSVVVDLGCGTGNCLNQIVATSGDLPAELIGVDSSPQMLKTAKRKLRQDSRVKFVNTSLLDWMHERSPSSVDAAISVNVLYTMQQTDRERFWGGLARVIRPGGSAVVVTTDQAGIGPLAKQHLNQVPLWRAFPPRLVAVLLMNMVIWMFESNSVYDPASLETLMSEAEAAGFSVIKSKRCYGGEVEGVDVMLVLKRG